MACRLACARRPGPVTAGGRCQPLAGAHSADQCQRIKKKNAGAVSAVRKRFGGCQRSSQRAAAPGGLRRIGSEPGCGGGGGPLLITDMYTEPGVFKARTEQAAGKRPRPAFGHIASGKFTIILSRSPAHPRLIRRFLTIWSGYLPRLCCIKLAISISCGDISTLSNPFGSLSRSQLEL